MINRTLAGSGGGGGVGKVRVAEVKLTLAGLLVAHGLRVVARESFLAVVAEAAGGVVAASNADAATSAPAESIQLGVELALTRVPVAIACCMDAWWWLVVVVGRSIGGVDEIDTFR